MNAYYSFFLIVFFLPCFISAQQPMDSMEVEMQLLQIDSLLDWEKFKDGLERSDRLEQQLRHLKNDRWAQASYQKGRALVELRKLDEAEAPLEEALHHWRSKEDTINHFVADIYYSIGELQTGEGNLKEGIQSTIIAKNIYEELYGKSNSDYARCLNVLGDLHGSTGDKEQAENFFMEAKALYDNGMDKNDPVYATTLFYFAFLNALIGMDEKSEQFYLEAMDIQVKVGGKENLLYASSSHNLANLYRDKGNYDKAKPLFQEAIAIKEQLFGKLHPSYSSSVGELAVLYYLNGDYEKAELLYLECKDIDEKTVGKEHHFYANTLYRLGQLYMAMKAYEKAEPIMSETNALDKKIMGRYHSYYAGSTLNLARLYLEMGRQEAAESHFLEYFTVKKQLVAQDFSFLSENEKEKYIEKNLEPDRVELHALGLQLKSPKLNSLQYELALFSKGLRLAANQSTTKFVFQSADTSLINSYNELLDVQKQLGMEYQKPVAVREKVEELEARKEQIEKQLSRASKFFRIQQRANNVAIADIRASLQPNEASIEFVHFRYNQDSVLYAAIVIVPENEAIAYIPLFEEKTLNQVAVQPKTGSGYVKQLYAGTRGVTGVQPRKRLHSLYELIWKPLDPLLNNKERIYYASTGLMSRLNLGAMVIGEEKVLADKYELVNLSSTRLVALEEEKLDSRNAFVMGGVIYTEEEKDQPALAENPSQALDEGIANFAEVDIALRGTAWDYLQWTEQEGKDVSKKLRENGYNVHFVKGTSATEEAFKTLGTKQSSPRIIHLATHGFFFPDPADSNVEEAEPTDNKAASREPVFKVAEHPMLRSGLLLSGANHAWSGGAQLPGKEDGILTAYEIANMNLTNTELVVLSACETGLGDIQGSEGVYGLQRAFKKAGVRYQIMSLWQIPDQETSVFMTRFYENWLDNQMPIREAFNKTQLEMRDRFSDPFLWAGFVLIE